MAGGLLNLIAIGNQNIILNGNPTKSFFKTKYVKYTNFGLQKFRVDQQGQTSINLNNQTKYNFKIPRYGDLLMDVYLVVTLPTIWSPILKYIYPSTGHTEYRPYEFQWIKNIGTQLINNITISIGGRLIQQFTGSYIQNMVERDFDINKKKLFNLMIGNITELTDPANFSNRNNNYPNAFLINDLSNNTIEPSIYSYQLFIPLNSWFSLSSALAIPLICLQYAELEFTFELRPWNELFTIRDVLYDTILNPIKYYTDIPRIHCFQNVDENYGFHRFIQQPPYRDLSSNVNYPTNILNLSPDTDVHLITTQCFLDTEERYIFANNIQTYLIKLIYEYDFQKINKANKIKLESNGLVSSWMWYFQRDDVLYRNEWSNYTNWNYEDIVPNNLIELTDLNIKNIYYDEPDLYNDISKNIFITGFTPTIYQKQNFKSILNNFGIICDGKYRENLFPAGIYNRIEKYTHNNGFSKDGLYSYNFTLNSNPFIYQPMGAFNTNKFKTIEFEYNLYANPPIDLSAVNFQVICDPVTNQIIGTTKEPTSIYSYNYNLHIYEERYNVLIFQSGVAELLYSR